MKKPKFSNEKEAKERLHIISDKIKWFAKNTKTPKRAGDIQIMKAVIKKYDGIFNTKKVHLKTRYKQPEEREIFRLILEKSYLQGYLLKCRQIKALQKRDKQ